MMSTASSNAPPSQRFSDKFPTAEGGGGGGERGMLGIDRAINNRLKVPVTTKKKIRL